MIKIKRIYDPPSPDDGRRVLVDRLWPRGIKKEDAEIDAWLKEIAPGDELRKWFAHDPERWPEFKARYKISSLLSKTSIKGTDRHSRGLYRESSILENQMVLDSRSTDCGNDDAYPFNSEELRLKIIINKPKYEVCLCTDFQ